MRLVAVMVSIGLFAAGATRAEEAPRIGTIKTLRGDARIVGAAGSTAASVGAAVHQNDTLETGTDGAVGVTFIDNTTLSLGTNSRITMTKVVFDPDHGDLAFASNIARGTFMFVSGSIAKLAPQAVQITTPVSTIGVRGTRFLVEVRP